MRGLPTTVVQSRCHQRPSRGRCCAAMQRAKQTCPWQTACHPHQVFPLADPNLGCRTLLTALLRVVGDKNKRQSCGTLLFGRKPATCGTPPKLRCLVRARGGEVDIRRAVGETLWGSRIALGFLSAPPQTASVVLRACDRRANRTKETTRF